jgi:hypothetical protein
MFMPENLLEEIGKATLMNASNVQQIEVLV